MYGYVVPDKPNMFIKDFAEFKANYCGFCKAIGKRCGTLMRFSTNYDITFLNVFAHSILKFPLEYKYSRCILHPFKKRLITVRDALTERVIDINTLLLYYKLLDDICDKDKRGRKIVFAKVRRKYKKTLDSLNRLDATVKEQYDRLNAYERAGCTELDEVADCFGKIMQAVGIELFAEKASENVLSFMYQLGRWVYFADAADDLEKDFKHKLYNPFLKAFEGFTDRESYLEKYKDDFAFVFRATEQSIKSYYDKLDVQICEGILTNTVYYGLQVSSERVRGRDKCQKIRL